MLRPEPRPPLAVERDHHARPAPALHEARRHDAHHARVPALAGHHDRGGGRLRRAGALGGEQDPRLRLPAVAVEQVELAATSAARASSSVSSSSSAAAARCMRPAALMRGPSRKPSACSPTAGRLDGRDLHQRPQPGLAGPADSAATPSRTMRRFSSRSGTTSQTVASAARSRSSSASAGSRPARGAQPLRELERHAGGAELGAGIVPERRVHHRAVGQLRAAAVVVGHHHVHPGGARGGHLGDRGDPAVHRHEQVHARRRQPLDGGRWRGRTRRRSGWGSPRWDRPRARAAPGARMAVEQTPSTS